MGWRMNEAEVAIVKVLALCDFWDSISKGPTPTTTQLRKVIGPAAIENAQNAFVLVDMDQLEFDIEVKP